MNSAIITITSDWGNCGLYKAAIEGALLKHLPLSRIIPISHDVSSFNMNEASFIIKNIWHRFPEGTIHLIAVNCGKSKPIVIQYSNHFFVGPDNGIFGLIFDKNPQKAASIDVECSSKSFPEMDYLVKAAIHLASGKPLEELGQPLTEISNLLPYKAIVNNDSISGIVMYIDNYGNAITNISNNVFSEAQEKQEGKSFTIKIRNEKSSKIHTSYDDVLEGDTVTLFGYTQMLEIAINKGSAKDLLGLNVGEQITIVFE